MVINGENLSFSSTSEDYSRDLSFSSTSEDYSRDDSSDRGGSNHIWERIGFKRLLAMRSVRNTNFRENGGEILKQQGVQIFPKAKLAKATNNYNDSNKLRDDDFGSVYRGKIAGEPKNSYRILLCSFSDVCKISILSLPKKKKIAGDDVVVVRKPKDELKSQIKGDFQREIEFLMKTSHKNVVKLKGICLETRMPLLVYEYIPNGTLFEHIHQDESTILKSWEDRFRIAAEAALALSYMHSSIKPPIVHGNIKSANILLDQNDLDQSYLAKVSDVGTSVLISPKHRYIVATQKQDSLGYIDPEYLITRILTTESDVYSFGVVLVELLTGKELFVTESGESINMIHCFISSVKGNTLSDVVDFEEASDDEMKRVAMVAEIAVECLDQKRANRPAMREVARRLAAIHRGLAVEEVEENIEETGYEEDAEKPSP